MAIRGLQRCGLKDEAARLRERILPVIESQPIIWEFYNSQIGVGLGCPHYGWTSALYLDLILQPDLPPAS